MKNWSYGYSIFAFGIGIVFGFAALFGAESLALGLLPYLALSVGPLLWALYSLLNSPTATRDDWLAAGGNFMSRVSAFFAGVGIFLGTTALGAWSTSAGLYAAFFMILCALSGLLAYYALKPARAG
jgi:hypothetical protein